jgi:Zn-finger nucleic acid-binding protein
MCCGIFVAVEDLKALISEQEKRAMSPAPGAHGPAGTTATAQPVAYLPCPVCQGLMNRVNYGRSSGVIIDHCRNHGYWLDAGELEKIAQWVAAGGHLKQYQREADEAREGQRRGSSGSTANVVVPSIPADYESSVGVSFGILGFLADLFDLKR